MDTKPVEGKARSSEQAIHQELLFARKRPGGLSPHTMAQCPVMCDLLGNGDPEVALVELNHKIIELIESDDDIIAIEAASYSLGLCTYADTHLARLEEFGSKHFLDQRQARRYSDRGLLQLARLIATHWTTQTVPEAQIIIVGMPPDHLGLGIQLKCQRHIEMSTPKVTIWHDDEPEASQLPVQWQTNTKEGSPWIETELTEPQIIQIYTESTLRVLWRGETWPKFTVALTGDIDAKQVTAETLGAACAVTVLRHTD